MYRQRRDDGRSLEPLIFKCLGEQCPLDETKITPFEIFLALCDDEFRVRQGADDRADLFFKCRCRPDTAMTVRYLIASRLVWMWPNQNPDLLPMGCNALDEFPE